MIIPMLCVTIFVILVVWFLLPRVARLMIHTPTAISIFVCLSMVQLMAVFISMRPISQIGRAVQQECRDLHSFPTRRSSDLDTLTLADDRLEAFYDNPNALRDYFRDIGRMVLAAEGRKANDSHADCYQYFCVPEYGTANGRLHFHATNITDRKSGSAGMPRSTLFPYTTLFRS